MSRKRQRITHEDGSSQQRLGLGPRSLDTLPWNEVDLPERLDDAEGFFGLEEVSDVEVLRHSQIGKIEYRVGKAFRDIVNCQEADLLSYPLRELQNNYLSSF